jgi:NADH:ubiquinone oxidoreductase subunit 5 (subunit L)/multisubunit Na+/H+ antiporter MnhA subunit
MREKIYIFNIYFFKFKIGLLLSFFLSLFSFFLSLYFFLKERKKKSNKKKKKKKKLTQRIIKRDCSFQGFYNKIFVKPKNNKKGTAPFRVFYNKIFWGYSFFSFSSSFFPFRFPFRKRK